MLRCYFLENSIEIYWRNQFNYGLDVMLLRLNWSIEFEMVHIESGKTLNGNNSNFDLNAFWFFLIYRFLL